MASFEPVKVRDCLMSELVRVIIRKRNNAGGVAIQTMGLV